VIGFSLFPRKRGASFREGKKDVIERYQFGYEEREGSLVDAQEVKKKSGSFPL